MNSTFYAVDAIEYEFFPVSFVSGVNPHSRLLICEYPIVTFGGEVSSPHRLLDKSD